MIEVEYLNDYTLVKHYSTEGYMLLQNETGAKYADPIDIFPCSYTYTETDELIEAGEENQDVNVNEATIADYQDALGEFGVNL